MSFTKLFEIILRHWEETLKIIQENVLCHSETEKLIGAIGWLVLIAPRDPSVQHAVISAINAKTSWDDIISTPMISD